MRYLACLGFAGLVSFASMGTARADEEPGREDVPLIARVPHGSHRAYTAGIALTATGASFLATGVGLGVLTLVVMSTSGTGGEEGGMGAMVAGMLGGFTAAGLGFIGLSTLIPGIVLLANNHPIRLHADDTIRDAHAKPPVPAFTSIPLLSAHF